MTVYTGFRGWIAWGWGESGLLISSRTWETHHVIFWWGWGGAGDFPADWDAKFSWRRGISGDVQIMRKMTACCKHLKEIIYKSWWQILVKRTLMDEVIILLCSCFSSIRLFCFLTNQCVFNIYNVLSTKVEEKIYIKVSRKGFKDESPIFGQGFDFICGLIIVKRSGI